MAKVVVDNSKVVAVDPWQWRARLKFFGVAAGAAVIWWLATSILSRYVVEPLACRSTVTLAACGDATAIAGSVAAIFVAAVALLGLAVLHCPRPLLVVTYSAVVLWSFGLYVTGLPWYEAILWSVLAYSVTYGLFSLVGRIRSVWMSLIVATICMVAVRLLTAF